MKQTITLALLAGANILVTLAFQWVVIVQLGVGIETDALFAGMAVPQLILSVVSSSLTHVLVPLLAVENELTVRRNSWGFFLGISAVFTILALVLFLTANGHLIYIRSLANQEAWIAGTSILFAKGELIHTEYSYKYSILEFRALAARAGFHPIRTWTDPGELFSVHYFQLR